MRLGIALESGEAERLRKDPSLWQDRFHAIGFSAFNDDMCTLLSNSLIPGCYAEICVDLTPEGKLTDTLGLCVLASPKQLHDPSFL